MVKQGVTEEHPILEPSSLVSNAILAQNSDGQIRITLSARNVNKAIEPANVPIPRHEDIKGKIAGCKVNLHNRRIVWEVARVESDPDPPK